MKLLVQLGGLDLGQQLTLSDLGADVHVPAPEIAARARVDRRVRECLGRAGQDQLVGRRIRRWMHDGNGNDCGFRCRLDEGGLRLSSRLDASMDDNTEGDEHDHHHEQRHPAGDMTSRRGAGLGRGWSLGSRRWLAFRHSARPPALVPGATVATAGGRGGPRLKTEGTKKRVAIVAVINPPMTARPSGAFCSPPSPSPSAIGTMPMIIASAVIRTGRNRVKPASTAAAMASPRSASRSLAKAITRMLFAVPTPMHMIAPISAGTLSVVPVTNRNTTIPASAAGSAAITMSASSHDWKLTTIRR